MRPLPDEPIAPSEFIEELLPALFADLSLDEAERALELRVGVVMTGPGGGEWTLHLVAGELGIERGRDPDSDLTLLSSVGDWRSALWEGRPGLVADAVTVALRGDRPAGLPHRGDGPVEIPGLSDLRGLVEIVVEDAGDARRAADEGVPSADWRVGILIGPGPIPDAPQASIRLGADEAEAIRRGELHPLEALITGRLRLDGDLGLILQLQAVAMTLSMTTGRG
ncbi:MAG: SCP2 sterol-binding domain-containing protein [Myxococcota bacterium]